jgi:hypothetical protein
VTTRSRPRPGGTKSYTARLQQRAAAAPQTRHLPVWLTARSSSALLALTAEAGHLAAVLLEWPGAPTRGVAHVVAAACLGMLSMTLYFGQSKMELLLGMVLTLTVPGVWLVSVAVGLPLYRDFPLPAAIAVSTVELGAAILLAAHLRPARRRSRRTSRRS